MNFFLQHERTSQLLGARATLRNAGVQAGDVLRIVGPYYVDPDTGPCGLIMYKLDHYLRDTLPGENPGLSISFPQPESEFVENWPHHATSSKIMQMEGELFMVTISVSRLE